MTWWPDRWLGFESHLSYKGQILGKLHGPRFLHLKDKDDSNCTIGLLIHKRLLDQFNSISVLMITVV